MKKLMLAAAVFVLAVPALAIPSLAQPSDRHDSTFQRRAEGRINDRPQRPPQNQAPQIQAPQNRPAQSRPDRGARPGNLAAPRPENRPDMRSGNRAENRRDNRPDNRPGGFRPDSRRDNRPDNRPGFRPDNRPDNRPDFRPDNRRGPDFRSGPGRPRQDWNIWRNDHRDFRPSRRYHAPSYRRPQGWYYRRWSFGDFLPSLFWSSQYWINSYSLYDLPPPPPGAVWVRYGDDAVLIDRFTGEVIDVVYGFFY